MSTSLLLLVLRERCYNQCNPGAFKQRLVRHSRDSEENWGKMAQFKRNCTTGCDFAMDQSQSVVPLNHISLGHRADILTPDQVDESRARLNRLVSQLETGCTDRCQAQFPGESKHKALRSCVDGCEIFFQRLD